MESIEHWLFRLGVPTYKTFLQVDLGAQAQNIIELTDKVPENVAWVYGMNVNLEGTFPTDNSKPLINLPDAGNLWLTLKYGTSDFVDTLRLSTLSYVPGGGNPRIPSANYCPVSIPMGTDWRKSKIYNSTGIVDKTIMIDIYFIDIATYNNLTKSGMLWNQGIKPNM